MKNEKFDQAIEGAKLTTAPGCFTMIYLMKSGRVEAEHNRSKEEADRARIAGRMARHVPNLVAERVIVDSNGGAEFLIGGEQ